MSIQGISNQRLTPPARVLVLAFFAIGTWVLLSLPAFAVAGAKGIEGVSWAAVSCAAAGLPVVWLVSQIPLSPLRVWFVVAGMCLRMVSVATVVILVWKTRPDLGWANFYCWLVVFYQIMLMAETYLTLPGAENSIARP